MYFKKMDMHGFKSFSDPVSIEFHKGITCVVGPNGSGKSNISDALRWVLGEQSPKTLRGGKMEEVIFSGTATRKSKGMAEVTLVIDNEDKSLAIDYSEVAITRKMYRSGDSEYYINNNPCRLKDIRELIMDTGIAVDGYSIIGQGKISDIVSNKTESRREIFEEAAGIVKYRSKKEAAERKLEATNHNLERVNDIIGEIEGRIGTLKEDSHKAKEFLTLRERQKTLEINITLKNIETIELKNEYLKDDILEVTNEIESAREAKSTLEEDIVQNKARNAELDTLEREAQDELRAAISALAAIKNSSDVNGERVASIEKDCIRIESEISEGKAKREREEATLSDIESQKSSIDEEIRDIRQELDEQNKEAESRINKMNLLAKDTEDQKNTIYQMYNSISAKKAELASYENIISTLQRRKSQIVKEQEDSGEAGELSSARYGELVRNTKEQSELLSEIESNVADRENALNESLQDEKAKTKALHASRIQKSEISARKKAIEELEASYEGYNHAVRYLMKNASQIGGIYGVVADLIQVPRGYEVAIETALGSAMQNIVCREEKDAQRAIGLLKEHKAGRLTFLPVNSVKANGFKGLEQAFRSGGSSGGSNRGFSPAGVKGIASECINYDSRYESVMQYLLGKVILVDNLENAIKLSSQAAFGARFVTLEGDVISPGGAITGGFNQRGTGSLLGRKTEAKELEDKLIDIAAVELSLSDEIEKIKRGIQALQEDLGVLRQKRRDEEIKLTNLKNQCERMEADVKSREEAENKRQRELESIDEEQEATLHTTKSLESEITRITAQVEQMRVKTGDSQKDYEIVKQEADLLNEKITQTKLKAASLESEKNNLETLSSRVRTYIAELDMQNDEKREFLARQKAEKEELLRSVTTDHGQIELREQEIKDLEEKQRAFQEEKYLTTRYLSEVEAKRGEIDGTILNYQSQSHELELKLTKNQSQVDSYKDRLWEEFEISYIHAMEFKSKEFVMNTAVREAREVKERMKELGEVNIGAIAEYETTEERFKFLTEQREDLLSAIKSLTSIIEDMDRTIKQKFKESFELISEQFKVVFKELFGGGLAELKIEDEGNLMDSPIEIVAQPPGKRLQNINLMSGGEKSLTAIALMASVLKVKPTPFVILDEVEAALDEANIMRFAKYLKTFAEIQFVLVTHQKTTMEFADILYGVTMPEQGISKVLSLKLGEDAGFD